MVPISIKDYVRLPVKNNPGEKAAEVTQRLQATLAAHKAGKLCACGEPIWVIGSAEVGHMYFTCITGPTDHSVDYEIAEACDEGGV